MRYTRFPVTRKAKQKARKALILRRSLPESRKFGLNKSEAKKLGINSGVERAKQLSRSDSISFQDAQDVARFGRFLKRERTEKVQGSIDLWGGDDYIKKAQSFVKGNKRARAHIRQI